VQHTLAGRRRSRRVRSVADLVGNTPIVRVRRVTQDLPTGVEVYAKLEYFNPGGSVADRAALRMMRDAQAEGRLEVGKVLLDRASGDTGTAYSMLGAAMDVPVHLVVPADVTTTRKTMSQAFGTRIIDSDADAGSAGAVAKVSALVAKDAAGARRYFHADQFGNPANPRAHYLTTAPEIWEATGGRVTHVVAGLGTTGTLMGTGRRLKLYNPAVQVIAVEPEVVSYGFEGPGQVPAVAKPPIYHPSEIDALERVDADAGWEMTERLAREEGLLVGYSAGAAMVAALRVAQGLEQGVIVAVFPDHAEGHRDK
jgi:S-sulfo-L-cysteine synthase (O-acetyl-L-serine-dependent)